MAGFNNTQPTPVTRSDLAEIGEDLKQHFSSLIEQKLDPIARQLTDLSTTLKEVTSTADLVYDLSKATESWVKELHL